jgi:isochorismate synthase
MLQASNSICLDGMAGLLSNGKGLASKLDRPILVSLTQPFLIDADPVELFSSTKYVSDVRAFWEIPSEKYWIVGAGQAAEIRVEGPGRFLQAISKHQSLMNSAVCEDDIGPGPIFTGGFSFTTGASANENWQAFSEGILTLPRWQVVSQRSHRWLTLNVMVNGHMELDSFLDDLSAQGAALLQKRSSFPNLDGALLKPSTNHWRSNVEQALDAVKNRKLRKLTLARSVNVSCEKPILPEPVLQSLIHNYPKCRIFAFCRNGSCFVGASPEELVSLRNKIVTSTCLAGSAPRGISKHEDSRLSAGLLQSEKERKEHVIVVDWISKRMEKHCNQLKWDNVPHVLKLDNLQHLETHFVGVPKKAKHTLEFVAALHPTPAVGGIPLRPALELIEHLEEHARGWYTGPVGWIDRHGSGSFAIAIRCALLRGNEAFLYAGSGIVAGSDPDREYQETTIKFKPLLTALGIT